MVASAVKRLLWEIAKSRQRKSNEDSPQTNIDGAISGSHCCAPALPHSASPCSLAAPSLRLPAPSVLPIKRPCSLSRPGRAICNPKFGVYIYFFPEPRPIRNRSLTKVPYRRFAPPLTPVSASTLLGESLRQCLPNLWLSDEIEISKNRLPCCFSSILGQN